MATLKFTTKIGYVLTDVTSVVLADPGGMYGVKRNDTDAVIVPVDTIMTKTATGTYEYEFENPVGGVEYTFYVKWAYLGETHYVENIFIAAPQTEGVGQVTTPAAILAAYLINYIAIFTDPDDDAAWPLYINGLPDGLGTANEAAAVFDTIGLYNGKTMHGTLNQHFGIQIRIRAMSDNDVYVKADAIEAALANVHSINVIGESSETFRINNISQATPIIRLGPDEQRRMLCTLNYLLSTTEV